MCYLDFAEPDHRAGSGGGAYVLTRGLKLPCSYPGMLDPVRRQGRQRHRNPGLPQLWLHDGDPCPVHVRMRGPLLHLLRLHLAPSIAATIAEAAPQMAPN